MQGLFKRIWQWLKNLFGQLFGTSSQSGTSLSGRKREQLNSSEELSDTDYEFLFMQLMEGIGRGWHEGRVFKFFEKLEERGKPKPWIAWLERFGEKVLNSSAPNQLLAARMMRFGELAQSIPKIQKIGDAAYQVGRQIYTRDVGSSIWEYSGPDLETGTSETAQPLSQGEYSNNSASGGLEGAETLTLDELLVRLQQDNNLAQMLAEQLGVNSTDPQAIIDTLLSQYQQFSTQNEPETMPETVEEWFQLGLKQAESAHWEAAIAAWDKALELDPISAEIWQNRGSALVHLGRFEEALASYDRSIELDPNDIQIWNARGSVLFSMSNWPECLTCWDRIIEIQEDYYQAWYNRGVTLENMGQREEAIASYNKALEIEPNFELAKIKLNDLNNS